MHKLFSKCLKDTVDAEILEHVGNSKTILDLLSFIREIYYKLDAIIESKKFSEIDSLIFSNNLTAVIERVLVQFESIVSELDEDFLVNTLSRNFSSPRLNV